MPFTADLAGKTALVTGASSGFGIRFAMTLMNAGADVIIAARRIGVLESLVERSEGRLRAIAMDVSSLASVRTALGAVGPIDILVNNAGVTATQPVLSVAETDFDEIMGVNLRGAFFVAIEVAKGMKIAGRGGTIINIASILGLRQGGQVSTYAISKAALIQATKQMGLELARDGIRVNALAPGYFETDLNGEFFATPAGEALIKRIPQRRLGQPDDLDGPLLLLASDASRYMTGSVIVVDGGHLLSTL